jgi:oligoendopeptidase F
MLTALGKISGNNWSILHKTNLARIKGHGGNVPVSLAEAVTKQLDDDVAIRREGYEQELDIGKQASVISSYSICSIKAENFLKAKTRGFASVLEMRLYEEGIELPFFERAMSVSGKLAPEVMRCFEKKQAKLGEGAPKWYNLLYVSLGKNMPLSWDRAADTIERVGANTSAAIGGILRRAIAEHWIDYEPRPNKRSGACSFSLHAKNATYVMLTFKGSVKGFVSLAHELGHVIHHSLLQRNNYFDSHAPLSIGETVAIFFELVAQRELANDYPQYAPAVLESQINSLTTTFLETQSRFVFEKELCEICASRYPNNDELCSLMLTAQKSVFGDTGDSESYNPCAWVSKPHYYYSRTPYYNYTYVLGRLAAYQLYKNYLTEGTAFFRSFENILIESGRRGAQETLEALHVSADSLLNDAYTGIMDVIANYEADFL